MSNQGKPPTGAPVGGFPFPHRPQFPHWPSGTAPMTQQLLAVLRPYLPRRPGIFLGFLTLLAGLLALTGWNVTRSNGLDQARQAYARSELVPCLQQTLDHLTRRPWSREASLLAARCLSRLD